MVNIQSLSKNMISPQFSCFLCFPFFVFFQFLCLIFNKGKQPDTFQYSTNITIRKTLIDCTGCWGRVFSTFLFWKFCWDKFWLSWNIHSKNFDDIPHNDLHNALSDNDACEQKMTSNEQKEEIRREISFKQLAEW